MFNLLYKKVLSGLAAHNVFKNKAGILNSVVVIKSQNNYNSTSNISSEMDNKTGIITLKLRKNPANSLSLEFLSELTTQLTTLEKDNSVKGLIITSDVPKIFSAGLDIMEMYKPDLKRLKEFWKALQDFWIKLYMYPLPTCAAINGHSPAGGCIIAMSCDYRIMVEGTYTIGLNETLLGIVAPFWFVDVMKNTIGYRQSEKALQNGTMFKPEEALKIGLVDEVVNEARIIEYSSEILSNWIKIPSNARTLTKQNLRKPTVDNLIKYKEDDVNNFLNFLMQDSIQKSLKIYLELLKKKK